MYLLPVHKGGLSEGKSYGATYVFGIKKLYKKKIKQKREFQAVAITVELTAQMSSEIVRGVGSKETDIKCMSNSVGKISKQLMQEHMMEARHRSVMLQFSLTPSSYPPFCSAHFLAAPCEHSSMSLATNSPSSNTLPQWLPPSSQHHHQSSDNIHHDMLRAPTTSISHT